MLSLLLGCAPTSKQAPGLFPQLPAAASPEPARGLHPCYGNREKWFSKQEPCLPWASGCAPGSVGRAAPSEVYFFCLFRCICHFALLITSAPQPVQWVLCRAQRALGAWVAACGFPCRQGSFPGRCDGSSLPCPLRWFLRLRHRKKRLLLPPPGVLAVRKGWLGLWSMCCFFLSQGWSRWMWGQTGQGRGEGLCWGAGWWGGEGLGGVWGGHSPGSPWSPDWRCPLPALCRGLPPTRDPPGQPPRASASP